jgi:hypothetical protein
VELPPFFLKKEEFMKDSDLIWVKYIGTNRSSAQSWCGKRILFIKDKPMLITNMFFNHLLLVVPENFVAVQGNYTPPVEVTKKEIPQDITNQIHEEIRNVNLSGAIPLFPINTDESKPDTNYDPDYDDDDEGIEEEIAAKKKRIDERRLRRIRKLKRLLKSKGIKENESGTAS